MQGDLRIAGRAAAPGASVRGIPAELTVFVQKTYGLLSFSLALAAASCWMMLKWMPIVEVVQRDHSIVSRPDLAPWMFWGLVIAEFGFLFLSMFARSGTRSGEASPLGLVALGGFVLASGALLGPIVGTYVGLGMASTVAAAAVVTAVTFTALTAVVFLTGKNFSFLGGMLFVGLIALVVAMLVNRFFLHSAGFDWWMSAGGAVLFCGFILYDTSNVVRVYGPGNMVVPAVISLYLDILNLFLLLLHLLGGRRRD